MVNTELTLKCGHTIKVNLPDDINARSAIIKNYQHQDCLECRKQKEKTLNNEKLLRMAEIKKLCEPLKDEDPVLLKKAEKIRYDKLYMLDDMFDRLTQMHGFVTDKEQETFNHYRRRTVLRFCQQTSVRWWISHQTSPVESIIDELKKQTLVIEGQFFHEK